MEMSERARQETNRGHVAEGRRAKSMEGRTAQIPSDWWMWGAGGSILLSLVMRLVGREEDAQFIGQWAPTLLIIGIYNKIVKLMGSD